MRKYENCQVVMASFKTLKVKLTINLSYVSPYYPEIISFGDVLSPCWQRVEYLSITCSNKPGINQDNVTHAQ